MEEIKEVLWMPNLLVYHTYTYIHTQTHIHTHKHTTNQ